MTRAVLLVLLVAFGVMGPAQASVFGLGKATVVDGDEFAVDNLHFRFRDADAFDLGQTCRSAKARFDCGAKSREALEQVIAGSEVVCVGSSTSDATCYTDKKINLAEEMIRRGWALGRPDRAYDSATAKKLCGIEAEAKRAKRGAWQYAFEPPYLFRSEAGLADKAASCGNAAATLP